MLKKGPFSAILKTRQSKKNGELIFMEAARLFISLPFRAEGLEADHPGCLKTFDSRDIDRFLTALYKEINAVAAESDDLLVQEIVLGNGSASHLTADDLSQMIRFTRTHFHVNPQGKIRLTMTPSGFDFYKLNAVRQMKTASICFELPSLTDVGLREAGYHCSAETAAAALDCCFQNGFRQFCVFLTARSLQTEELEHLMKKLLSVQPEEIIFRKDAASLMQAGDRILTREGWVCADNHWYRESAPAFPPCTVQIGCGPNAVSVFDQIPVRSTADFDFYCSHSDDFEALVTRGESDHLPGISKY